MNWQALLAFLEFICGVWAIVVAINMVKLWRSGFGFVFCLLIGYGLIFHALSVLL